MPLAFHTLDVFTDRAFTGNPLAVVHDADALTGTQMQTVAREFNLSETVFVMKPTKPAHSARVRIFTPNRELPFAGHPTIGTAVLLADLRGLAEIHGERDALIVLEEEIGTVRVGVRTRNHGAPFAEFDAPKLPQAAGSLPPVDRLAAALDLMPNEIGFENHRPSCFAAGNTFAFVPISTLAAIETARINPANWSAAFDQQGLLGVFLYTRQCLHTASSFHARMFAPGAGVPEDPATGSAAVCFAGVVHEFDGLRDGTHARTIEQGYEMGRPSHIQLSIKITNRHLETVRIGGNAVRVSEGQVAVPSA